MRYIIISIRMIFQKLTIERIKNKNSWQWLNIMIRFMWNWRTRQKRDNNSIKYFNSIHFVDLKSSYKRTRKNDLYNGSSNRHSYSYNSSQYIIQQESVFLLLLSVSTYSCSYYSLSLINSFIEILSFKGSCFTSVLYLYLNIYLFPSVYIFAKNYDIYDSLISSSTDTTMPF